MIDAINHHGKDFRSLDAREIPRNLSDVEEIISEEGFEHFFEAVYQNFGEKPTVLTEDEKSRAIGTAKKAKEKWEQASGDKVYYGIADIDSKEMVATGFLDVMKMPDGKKQGWIKFLATEPDLRGWGLAPKIKKQIEKTARDKGCDTLNCTVLADNPHGLDIELKDGFIFTDLFADKDGKIKFFGYKRLDNIEDADKKNGPLGEMKEVLLSDVDTVKTLVDQNAKDQWAVIDIKNLGDRKINKSENWVLVLEKLEV